MERNVGLIILLVFVWLLNILFCSTFSAGLAQFKGRSRKWGFIGFLLGIFGLIIVCFLPSKRDDNAQTNPIKHIFSKIPSMSKKTIGLILGIAVAIVLTIIIYDVVPVIVQNQKYQQMTTKQNINTQQPKLLDTAVKDIFASGESSFVITENGELYCFGRQFAPSIDEGSSLIYKNVKKAISTDKECFILDNEGKLFSFSADEPLLICEGVVDFSASETTVGIIKNDGKLYMYGNGTQGQLGNGGRDENVPAEVLSDVKQVVCESSFTVALLKNDYAVAFGNNADGQFGFADISVPLPKTVYKNVKKVAAGDDFILLLDNDGNVLSCGKNDCGQLGNGNFENLAEFTQIMTDAVDIDAAKKSAFVLSKSGELYSFGQNLVGQLGSKNEQNQPTPTKVYKNVSKFDTSGLHTVAMTKEGDVVSTGFNSCAQLGRGEARNEFSTLITIKN